MDNITNTLVAFGLGSILTAVVQYFFSEKSKRKTLLFQEKKEAFVGLLEAYHAAAVEPSEKASKNFAYWQIRCELICSRESKAAIEEIVNSNDNPEWRMTAHKRLKECLSKDLRKSF